MSQNTEFKEDLPSVNLGPSDLRTLNEILINEDVVSNSIEVKSGGFTRKFSDLDDLLDEPTLDEFIYSLDWTVRYENGGIVTINYDSSMYGSKRLIVEGEFDWLKSTKEDILSFFGNKKRGWRTKARSLEYFTGFLNYIIFAGLITALGGIYVDKDSELAASVAQMTTFDYVFSGTLVTLFILGSMYLSRDPYFVINMENKELHPRFTRAIQAVSMAASALAIISFTTNFLV